MDDGPGATASELLISVVICTYRRPEALALALDGLVGQDAAGRAWEVIVVDSAAEQATRRQLAAWEERLPGLRYVAATQVGIPQARNHGWQAARGEYVAYIDDDCQTPPGWLALAAQLIQQYGPDLFGGPYYPYYVQPKPTWFRDAYGSGEPAGQAGWLRPEQSLVAGNLFMRRAVLADCGGFDPTMRLAEETELQRRLRRVRPETRSYYEPGLFLYHQVRPEKYGLRYQMRAWFNSGRYNAVAFDEPSHAMTWKHWAAFLGLPVWIGYGLSLGGWLRNRRVYPAYANYVFERVLRRVGQWGKLYEHVRRLARPADAP